MAGVSGSDRGSRTGVRSDSNSVSGLASGKEALWQGRVRRFRRSGQTVREFCAAEEVSTASFYQWRRRLAQRRPPRADVAGRASAFQAVRVRAVVSAISVHLPGGADRRAGRATRRVARGGGRATALAEHREQGA